MDSTRRAAEIGDRNWHALLDAHDAVVRVRLARFPGREVNTSGDGFLAILDGPHERPCAMAIRDAVQAFGIEVRAGLTPASARSAATTSADRCAHRRAGLRVRGTERGVGLEHAARFGDRVRAGIRRPRRSRTQGRARRMAALRRWIAVGTGPLERRGCVVFGDEGVVESRSAVTRAWSWARVCRRRGIITPRFRPARPLGGSPVHSVAVGGRSGGKSRALPGLVV